MPLFRFFCEACNSEVKRILSPDEAKVEVKCKKDGSILIRTPSEPITTVYETIDNGVMARKVVQPAGAPQMIEERSKQSLEDRSKKTLV